MPSYDSEGQWLIFGKCPRHQHFHVGRPQQAGVLGHRWPLIILKVPQTDSAGTHTYPCISISILLYGRDSPSWLVVKTSAKNAGSSIGNLLFSLSIRENAASAENWIQDEKSDFAETARAAGMMKEKAMGKQRIRETEREQLAQLDFLLSCRACLLSCLPGPCVPLYIKRGRHSLNSHSGSLSTAEREAPPQQTKWWGREKNDKLQVQELIQLPVPYLFKHLFLFLQSKHKQIYF